jgi:hypothetical protein
MGIFEKPSTPTVVVEGIHLFEEQSIPFVVQGSRRRILIVKLKQMFDITDSLLGIWV